MKCCREADEYFAAGKYKQAEEKYTECIKSLQSRESDIEKKTVAEAYNNRGQITYLRVDFGEAIEDYTEAINILPTFHIAYYNRGQIHYRLGRYNQAIPDFEKALDLEPSFFHAEDAIKTAKEEQALNEMANAIRTVSFVRHLELKVDRDVLPNAIKLGDVDNDKGNELVVGTISGMLYVFRGHETQAIWEHSDLGFITCLTVGDVLHEDSNSLLVVNAEGYCRIYSSHKLSSNLQLVHKQMLKGNARTVLLGDVDNDGRLELLMSHTDRMVSAYRWDSEKRELIFLQDWHLRNQIGCITLHHNSENDAIIIASQPGAMWAKLRAIWHDEEALANSRNDSYDTIEYSVMPRAHNPSVTCQIVGDILKGSQSSSGYFAICTLDGNIKLVEDGETLWSFQVDYQLFAIAKLDVLGNGKEEVIICSYDGQTYIIDHDKNLVRYQFEDTVKAFCAGQYAIDGCDENVPCLLYVDYKNRIKLYYDIELPHLQATDFLSYVEKDHEITDMFQKLNLRTVEEKRKFVQYFMYKHPAMKKTIITEEPDTTESK